MTGVSTRTDVSWDGTEPTIWVEIGHDGAELTVAGARALASELADLADQLDPPGDDA